MATSALPDVIDALIDRLPPILSIPVVDNYDATDANMNAYLIVGSVKDDGGTSGSSEQDWAYSNSTTREETGSVECLLYAVNGDGSTRKARDAVYLNHGLIAEHLRATPNLGLAQVIWTSFGRSTTFTQDSHEDVGAWAVLEFSIFFRAQL